MLPCLRQGSVFYQAMTDSPKQIARDFLANAAKRNHALEWHKDESGKTVITNSCPAVIHDGETVQTIEKDKCTCGATRQNLLVERALNTLMMKEKK